MSFYSETSNIQTTWIALQQNYEQVLPDIKNSVDKRKVITNKTSSFFI
jgi:hypothetical protein